MSTESAACLNGDHDFDMEDTYDFDSGEFYPPERQMQAKCLNCGVTLGAAINVLMVECETALGIRKAN